MTRCPECCAQECTKVTGVKVEVAGVELYISHARPYMGVDNAFAIEFFIMTPLRCYYAGSFNYYIRSKRDSVVLDREATIYLNKERAGDILHPLLGYLMQAFLPGCTYVTQEEITIDEENSYLRGKYIIFKDAGVFGRSV